MLKYCEAYRTMRESLCRENTRTDFCHGNSDRVLPQSKRALQITGLNCDEFPSERRPKACNLARNGVLKTKSEDGEVLERQNRRQSVNFEQEFTFTPRLNLTSVRMARERTTRVREAIERRANALVAEVQMNFTFKPKVSSRSEKIAQGLKTSFLERQLIHIERQRKLLDNRDLLQISHTSQAKLIPVILTRKQKKATNLEQSKLEKLTRTECNTDIIEKTEVTTSAPNCLSTVEPQKQNTEPFQDMQQSDKDFAQNTPYQSAVQNTNNRALRRHRRLKTHPGASSQKDGILEDDIMKPSKVVMKNKDGHRKASTVSGQVIKGSNYHNTPMLRKLQETKQFAENAMKNNKVFVCHGPYPVVRASLRKRGWVEKHFKGCPAVVANSKTDKPSSSDNEEDEGDHGLKVTGKTDNSNNEDNDGYESTDSAVWNAGYEGEDCEYSLLSRFCRNATATFFWTCKRDDIDFKYLRKDQIANHFSKAHSFTTKVGLCTHLRNLAWFEDANSDDFFPRCHRLGSDDEKEAFIDDYRITSACNILKLLIKHSKSQSASGIQTSGKKNSSITPRATIHSRTQNSPSCSAKSRRSHSSLAVGERPSMVTQVPSRAILLALRACRQFIMCRNNEDIDGHYEIAKLTEEDWDNLIGYYYQIIHKGYTIEGGEDFVERSEELLKEMRELLPQLDLDGVRNVWIVKPGAKSRGRGIMCMDRLEEILKIVSSTVKKENRWIVQKYIESPLLIYNTKFDIRQWFLVTDWNPLTLWFYTDCYFRFCSQEFTLDNFEPCIHLANNSIQKHYQNGVRDERLPENNMWSCDDFRDFLSQRGQSNLWEELIYPGMRQAIVYTLECCQLSLEARKNSFELYGADFMLTEDYKPWLIEINSSPAMGASTSVTRKLCANVIEDTMKVVLDRREDKNCDTGKFEMAFKQPFVDAPPYIGINLSVNGKAIFSPILAFRRQPSANRIEKLSRPREKYSRSTEEDTTKPENNTTTKHAMKSEDNTTADDNTTRADKERTRREKQSQYEIKEENKTAILKLKENNLTLDCYEKSGLADSLLSNVRQSRHKLLMKSCSSDLPRHWKRVQLHESDRKDEPGTTARLRTLSIDPNIKLKNKKTFENKFFKTKNKRIAVKKSKTAREDHVDSSTDQVDKRTGHGGNVSGVITIPDVGIPRTILRYTDKRYGQTKTVAIDMGTEAKLRKNTQVVK